MIQENCVHMSGCHHIDMFQIHVMHSCHEVCCMNKSKRYIFWMVYIPVYDHNRFLSMFAYASLISHLAIFPRNLASSNFLELYALF